MIMANLTKEQIKRIQREAHAKLELLGGSEASFLFIGDEGQCFVINGNTTNIKAELMFSMIRYPIIRDIVKECAEKFDFLEAEMGDNIRNMTMDHIIEQYS